MSKTIIETKDLTSIVKQKDGSDLITVKNINIEFKMGRSYAIIGKSGSGKTSLISILGLLNSTFEGKVIYKNLDIGRMSDRQVSKLRSRSIGFVFQNYSLIRHLKVWENIELSIIYSKQKMSKKQRLERIDNVLKSIGLESKRDHFPSDLSGGEQQRIAIARALVINPEVLICDEPTGALDSKTGQQIIELLLQVTKNSSTILILVTHDIDIAVLCDTIFQMEQGEIVDVSNNL